MTTKEWANDEIKELYESLVTNEDFLNHFLDLRLKAISEGGFSDLYFQWLDKCIDLYSRDRPDEEFMRIGKEMLNWRKQHRLFD